MTVVISRSSVPEVRRARSHTPGEVLFKRGVKRAGVAATGGVSAARSLSSSSSVLSRVSKSIPVEFMLGALRGARQCVGSVASELTVEPTLTAPVASAYQSSAFPNLRFGSPASTLSLVLRSLRRRAAAAKVLRGRRRLGVASETGRALPFSAASLGRASVVKSVLSRQLVRSESRSELSCSVAFASDVSVLREQVVQIRNLH